MFEVEDFAKRCRLAPASLQEGSRPARGNWLIFYSGFFFSWPGFPFCSSLPRLAFPLLPLISHFHSPLVFIFQR